MKTKVTKVELWIVDHDHLGEEGIKSTLENTNYPNHCMGPSVIKMETREVDWIDEHPLNQYATMDAAIKELFS